MEETGIQMLNRLYKGSLKIKIDAEFDSIEHFYTDVLTLYILKRQHFEDKESEIFKNIEKEENKLFDDYGRDLIIGISTDYTEEILENMKKRVREYALSKGLDYDAILEQVKKRSLSPQ
jgi:hypothetical protein